MRQQEVTHSARVGLRLPAHEREAGGPRHLSAYSRRLIKAARKAGKGVSNAQNV